MTELTDNESRVVWCALREPSRSPEVMAELLNHIVGEDNWLWLPGRRLWVVFGVNPRDYVLVEPDDDWRQVKDKA